MERVDEQRGSRTDPLGMIRGVFAQNDGSLLFFFHTVTCDYVSNMELDFAHAP